MTELQIKILELHSAGSSYNEIVKVLGCSKGTVSYYCGQDQKTKALIRQRDKRSSIRKYIQEFKTDKSCMDCGNEYPHFIFEFDHRPDEEKLFNISQAPALVTIEKLKEEIDKCDIVCANCHRARTWFRLVSSGDSLPSAQ